jgi:NAD(P)H-hydrate epimerase
MMADQVRAAPQLPALTTAQMAEVDRLMIAEYGILLIQMMEHAGRNLAEQARRMLDGQLVGRTIAVLCGAGNNGGGGMVAARHLANWGADVRVYLATDPARLKEIPAHQWRILRAMGVPGVAQSVARPAGSDLIVDAIIGYGLRGEPRGSAVGWIAWANTTNCPILALDTPSGLDTTTGIPGIPCIRATATLTLALPKTGLLAPPARSVVGDLYLADISVPPALYRSLGLEIGPLFTNDTIIPVGYPHGASDGSAHC